MVQKSLCARAQEKSRPKRFAEQLIAFGGLRIAALTGQGPLTGSLCLMRLAR